MPSKAMRCCAVSDRLVAAYKRFQPPFGLLVGLSSQEMISSRRNMFPARSRKVVVPHMVVVQLLDADPVQLLIRRAADQNILGEYIDGAKAQDMAY